MAKCNKYEKCEMAGKKASCIQPGSSVVIGCPYYKRFKVERIIEDIVNKPDERAL